MYLSLVVPFATYRKMQDRVLALCAVLGDSVQPWACSNLIRFLFEILYFDGSWFPVIRFAMSGPPQSIAWRFLSSPGGWPVRVGHVLEQKVSPSPGPHSCARLPTPDTLLGPRPCGSGSSGGTLDACLWSRSSKRAPECAPDTSLGPRSSKRVSRGPCDTEVVELSSDSDVERMASSSVDVSDGAPGGSGVASLGPPGCLPERSPNRLVIAVQFVVDSLRSFYLCPESRPRFMVCASDDALREAARSYGGCFLWYLLVCRGHPPEFSVSIRLC